MVADTDATLVAGYAELARLLNLPERESADQAVVREAVKRWLQTHNRWLLVLDNADEPERVKPYLPLHHHGHLLVTSRRHRLQTLGILAPLELPKLPPPDSLHFLQERTGRHILSPPEQQAATDLVDELDGLPLALEQAGAYLHECGASFVDYLAAYRRQPVATLQKAGPTLGTGHNPIAVTWALNFAEVEKSPASASLLRLSAFLSPDNIPLDLLAQGADAVDSPLRDALLAVADNPLSMNDLLLPLQRYSLIQRDPGAPSYAVHRLIQAVVRNSLDAPEQWAGRSVQLLNRVFPSVEFNDWPLCEQLIPHALACAESITKWNIQANFASRLLNQAGYYLSRRARYVAAEPLYRRALAICEAQLGPDHPDTALSLNNLASLLDSRGDLAGAEPLYRRALAIREAQLGPDHPDTARSLNNLASLLDSRGDLAGAEPLYRRALAIYEAQLGSEHPTTQVIARNLALFLAQRNKARE